MKRQKFNIIIATLLFFFSTALNSCIGAAMYNKELCKGYELSATEEMSDMCIYVNNGPYQVAVIDATVFSVGFDDNFIIAQKHPLIENKIDKSIIQYFIISTNDTINVVPEDNKIGPLSREEFKLKRKELEIPNKLNFTITINSLK